MTTARHLIARWWGMVRGGQVLVADEIWAEDHLSAEQKRLWRRLGDADRRHAVMVARRFVDRVSDANSAEIAGALLHDIGKVDLGWGPLRRILGTVGIDPSQRYGDHERRGAEMLARSGSDPVTVALVDTELAVDDEATASRLVELRNALAWADHI